MNSATATTVTLGKTTYQVENFAGRTALVGPRGATYLLRPFLGEDTGKRQVISLKSGQPLRVRGNEVRVFLIGDQIEVA